MEVTAGFTVYTRKIRNAVDGKGRVYSGAYAKETEQEIGGNVVLPPAITPRESICIQDGKTCEQQGSLWFKLPAELRNRVYEEIFREGRVHVLITEERLICFRASLYQKKVVVQNSAGLGVLSLILTCRLVYDHLPLLLSPFW